MKKRLLPSLGAPTLKNSIGKHPDEKVEKKNEENMLPPRKVPVSALTSEIEGKKSSKQAPHNGTNLKSPFSAGSESENRSVVSTSFWK